MKEILRSSSRILFVDPFYDAFSVRYKSTFRECFAIVSALNPNAVCEIHYRYHEDKPTNKELEHEAVNLFPGVVPVGLTVTLFCWQEKAGGEDFHDRYLLTDRGGILVGAGFSAEGRHQTTVMSLMTFALSQEKLKTLARQSTCFNLIGPVIRVGGDGKVERM